MMQILSLILPRKLRELRRMRPLIYDVSLLLFSRQRTFVRRRRSFKSCKHSWCDGVTLAIALRGASSVTGPC